MYDPSDRYYRHRRQMDAAQAAWDNAEPDDDDINCEPECEPEDNEPEGDEAADFGGMDV